MIYGLVYLIGFCRFLLWTVITCPLIGQYTFMLFLHWSKKTVKTNLKLCKYVFSVQIYLFSLLTVIVSSTFASEANDIYLRGQLVKNLFSSNLFRWLKQNWSDLCRELYFNFLGIKMYTKIQNIFLEDFNYFYRKSFTVTSLQQKKETGSYNLFVYIFALWKLCIGCKYYGSFTIESERLFWVWWDQHWFMDFQTLLQEEMKWTKC